MCFDAKALCYKTKNSNYNWNSLIINAHASAFTCVGKAPKAH